MRTSCEGRSSGARRECPPRLLLGTGPGARRAPWPWPLLWEAWQHRRWAALIRLKEEEARGGDDSEPRPLCPLRVAGVKPQTQASGAGSALSTARPLLLNNFSFLEQTHCNFSQAFEDTPRQFCRACQGLQACFPDADLRARQHPWKPPRGVAPPFSFHRAPGKPRDWSELRELALNGWGSTVRHLRTTSKTWAACPESLDGSGLESGGAGLRSTLTPGSPEGRAPSLWEQKGGMSAGWRLCLLPAARIPCRLCTVRWPSGSQSQFLTARP